MDNEEQKDANFIENHRKLNYVKIQSATPVPGPSINVTFQKPAITGV